MEIYKIGIVNNKESFKGDCKEKKKKYISSLIWFFFFNETG